MCLGSLAVMSYSVCVVTVCMHLRAACIRKNDAKINLTEIGIPTPQQTPRTSAQINIIMKNFKKKNNNK